MSALLGGVIIALFNKFVLTGAVCKWISPYDDDDDGQSSSSTVGAEIHMHQ